MKNSNSNNYWVSDCTYDIEVIYRYKCGQIIYI